MSDIANNLANIHARMRAAQERCDRASDTITLLAVSKKQSIAKIKTAVAAGQSAFAENYCQEAINKIIALKALPIEWHFIGSIQSNKTREIATHFAWVHSVSRFKIATRLNEQRSESLPSLNVCIEVNIDQQQRKAGVRPDEVIELAQAINQLENLNLRGLMIIPEPVATYEAQLTKFQQLTALQQMLIKQGIHLDTLSMGMSSDFEAAICAGSTMVRIGTAIFGPR